MQTPWGSDIEVTDITASIIVRRQSATYVLSTIVPVIVVTSLALLTFLLAPDQISTRLSCAQTMFLMLVAVSWVSEGFTPKASYPLPTRVLGELVCLLWWGAKRGGRDPTHSWTRSHPHPPSTHSHAVMLSYAVLIIVAIETIAVMAIRNGVSLSERTRRVRTGRNEHVASMLAKLKLRKRRDAALPTANNGGGGGGFGGVVGAGVTTSGSGGLAPSKAVDAADDSATNKARDARISFHEWLAETLDLVTFVGLTVGYAIGAALIFVFAQARQPGLCEMSGAPAGCMDQLGRA